MASLSPSRLQSFAEMLENVLEDVENASPATQARVRKILKRRVSSLSTSLASEEDAGLARGRKKSTSQNDRQMQIDSRGAAIRAEL
ncbi:hypothetical protein PLICRDRAFT_42721 [Plicaturopsis crispa FD-325 SS-3]|nr:hypothetical protein PLICRDRAFT_42721 [Plicaturopsis crispa FD-325 SS-3]